MKVQFMFTHLLLITVASVRCRSAQRHGSDGKAPRSAITDSTSHWGGQKSCPVTGEALGSMGDPIRVRTHDQTVWVCCESCVAAVKDDPDKYFEQVQNEITQLRGPVIQRHETYDRSDSRRVAPASGSCH